MRVSCVNDSYCEGKGRKSCAFFLLYNKDEQPRRRSSSFVLVALLFVRHTEKLRRSRDHFFLYIRSKNGISGVSFSRHARR